MNDTSLGKKWPICLIDRSDWPPLRSLNSCCHCLRQVLLLDCWGSRSPAWRLRLSDFCEGSDRMAVNRLGRLGRLSGMWLDMATRSQNQGMLATPEQSEWFSYMGSLATSPPLCPIWLMVRRCILLDPTMANWTHPLLWPGDLVPVTQNRWLVVEPRGK